MAEVRPLRITRRLAAAGALAALAACGGPVDGKAANWLTMPTTDGHAAYLPLRGTPHDPTAPGATISCASCHDGPTFLTFDCVGCHTPAQTDPIHVGIAAGYVSPPTSAACYRCHPQGVGLMTPAAHAGFFAIGTASHPAVCSSCHTDAVNRKDLATLACAACHQGRPGFASAHAAVKDYPASPVSADCLSCHADDQVHRVADHQAAFPVAMGSVTHDTACLHCHTSPQAAKPWATDFSAFACVACHAAPATDPLHAGVTGYAWESSACYQCHPQGTGLMTPAAHAAFFAIGTASHPAVCTTCHTDPARRQDLSTLACAACHQGRPGFGTAHAAVKDYPASPVSADCLSCHADDQVHRIADHQASFPIAAGSATHDTACLHCHTSPQAARAWATDFSAFACVACHGAAATDPLHAGVTGYAWASSACYQCHPQGTAAPANHATALFPIGTGTAHDGVTCSQCHTDPARRQDTSTLACASCHQALAGFATAHTVTGYSILVVHTSRSASTPVPLTSPSCLRCHGDAQVDRVSAHPRGDSGFGTGNHRTAGCLTCHSAARADKPFAALLGTTPGCIVCHPNGPPN